MRDIAKPGSNPYFVHNVSTLGMTLYNVSGDMVEDINSIYCTKDV